MNTLMGIVTLVVVAAHIVVIGVAKVRSRQGQGGLNWLLATIALSALACATYLIPEDTLAADKYGRGVLLIVALSAMMIAYGGFVIHDMTELAYGRRLLRVWFGLSTVWMVAIVMAAVAGSTANVGATEWMVDVFDNPDAASIVTLIGLPVLIVVLLGFGFARFYQAVLPEVANRALFWILTTALFTLGYLLTGSGTQELALLGMVALLTGVIDATYANIAYRVFDIRSGLILALRTLTFVGMAAAMVFTALYLVLSADIDTSEAQGLLAMGAIALLIAACYVPLRQLTEFIIRQLTVRIAPDPAQAAREFSQQISENVELNALIEAVTRTLNKVMRVRRSCLILLNSTFKVKDAVELLVMAPGSDRDQMTGFISIFSPIYATLAAERRPLSQFDIEFNPKFNGADKQEVQFFRDLQMSAYAPVILENALIGVLACGPMVNDTAFYPRDLELLATLAQQTGVALRNARLVDDLQHLNKSMQSLNRGLKGANDQLGKLDAVKTDFVTIASHELRTPLAQIRGYSDIIDALNEQGLLDQEQTTGLVNNLRKATERMEELISAMLDVSQLDVNAMDLRFMETPPESVLRMAIEPLTDAIKQRKLTLSARGLRGLPSIQADLPRLVQAFRNIILNAIKFTPDGGRIDIVAALQPATTEGGVDHILVEIRDTGVGIDRKNLDLVFRKFFRAYDPSLHSTGTYKFLGAGPGLGLTIAKGVIEGHGGKIWAESQGHDMQTNPGSVFYVLLPVSTPDTARRVLTFEGEARPTERSTDPKRPENGEPVRQESAAVK